MGARTRRVADRDEAEALLEDWRTSGASFEVFVRSRGIDGRSLNCWRLNLQRQAPARRPASDVRFVELTTRAPVAQATYRVRIGDVEVQVDDHFREDTLVRLLGVVARC